MTRSVVIQTAHHIRCISRFLLPQDGSRARLRNLVLQLCIGQWTKLKWREFLNIILHGNTILGLYTAVTPKFCTGVLKICGFSVRIASCHVSCVQNFQMALVYFENFVHFSYISSSKPCRIKQKVYMIKNTCFIGGVMLQDTKYCTSLGQYWHCLSIH